jgi:hypothetical protein
MKRALIALAISAGLIAIGSSLCLPGICGCVSWLGIQAAGSLGDFFILLSIVGVFGVIISFCWLVVALILDLLKQVR